ncbi:MAG: hypothetical protein M9894_03495 [Planctomycetes bacterium]|nr:hypothetical protein [Planctomycetota bacterium]
MGGRKKAAGGPAAEAVGLRINEGPRRPRSLPFAATYLGEGVVDLPGVGLFARWTRAEVDAATADRLRGDPAWEVRPRVTPPAPDAPAGGA